jgi:hypothetical protein
MEPMKKAKQWIATAVCSASLVAAPGAYAGVLDGLFGGSKAGDASLLDPRTVWNIHDFSSIQLVPREEGAPDNRHPAVIDARTLQQLLESVRIPGAKGPVELVMGSEAEQLAEPLSQALASATPGQDVLLVSSERRIRNAIEPPTSVTARIFVNPEGLQLVVRDARFPFYDNWRGTGVTPTFRYGSRNSVGSAQLQSVLGIGQRADWLSFPLTVDRVSAIAPTLVKAVAPAPVQRNAAFFDTQELRLQKLKSLREKDLITDQEYQQKRQDILKDM